MASHPRNVILLVAVLTVLLQEMSTDEMYTDIEGFSTEDEDTDAQECITGKDSNSGNINADITEKNCPDSQCVECKRGMTWKSQFAKLYSGTFNLTFLCDTKTDWGGGWILIQRRVYKTTNFTRDWEEYKNGFGSICGDYWLGNENIYKITNSDHYELRVDMVFNSKKFYAQYKDFFIEGEDNNYRLRLGAFYKGNVRDDLMFHDYMQFSTPDRDNDINPARHCAKYFRSGWWYHRCHSTQLNGHFQESGRKYYGFSVMWEGVTGPQASLSSVEMKIRQRECPVDMKTLTFVVSKKGLGPRDQRCPFFVLNF